MNRIGAAVGGIGVTHLETEVLGIDIALEVNGLEVAKQHGVSRNQPMHLIGEGFHERFHELNIGTVGIKLQV